VSPDLSKDLAINHFGDDVTANCGSGDATECTGRNFSSRLTRVKAMDKYLNSFEFQALEALNHGTTIRSSAKLARRRFRLEGNPFRGWKSRH